MTDKFISAVLVLFAGAFLVFWLTFGVATTDSEAVGTAQSLGLRNVKPGTVSFLECGQDDKVGRSFTATNSVGEPVSGVVCCGFLKRCTVRF